jgi:hypothetical protein
LDYLAVILCLLLEGVHKNFERSSNLFFFQNFKRLCGIEGSKFEKGILPTTVSKLLQWNHWKRRPYVYKRLLIRALKRLEDFDVLLTFQGKDIICLFLWFNKKEESDSTMALKSLVGQSKKLHFSKIIFGQESFPKVLSLHFWLVLWRPGRRGCWGHVKFGRIGIDSAALRPSHDLTSK